MQDERKEQVEDSEEVGAHKRFGPSEEPPARSGEGEDEEVEGHRMARGPEEFGKRF